MSVLRKSLENSVKETEPWSYLHLENFLTEGQIQEILSAKLDKSNWVNDGTRSGNDEGDLNKNHPIREYLTKENIHKYPNLKLLIDDLKTIEIRTKIADLLNIKHVFENSYIRLEILNDCDGFWLKKHCDIPEKLISSLIYVNRTNEDISIGTDFYNQDLKKIKTFPYLDNVGYIFSGPNKWHGVDKNKKIKVGRTGLQLNYVTFPTDWPVGG